MVSWCKLKFPLLCWPVAAAPRGAGVAVGGQHQRREGGGAATSLVLLPAHGDHGYHQYPIDVTLLTRPLSSRPPPLYFLLSRPPADEEHVAPLVPDLQVGCSSASAFPGPLCGRHRCPGVRHQRRHSQSIPQGEQPAEQH